ncbi:MAG: hypothetical protein AB7L66_16155 [Gemmatimonadales bacterium]
MSPETIRSGLLGLLLTAAPASGRLAAQAPEPLVVTAAWAGDRYQGSHDVLRFALSRPLRSRERLALIVGHLDVSALLHVRGTTVRYRPTAARHPAGESNVVVYLVDSAGTWSAVGRSPLKVRTRLGLESGAVIPSLDLSSSGQLDRGTAANEPPPDRLTYQDFTLRVGFEGQATRSGWHLAAGGNAIGVTRETQRLRFGDLAMKAPAVDLSDYQVHLERGSARLAIGNVTAGNNRFLLSGFASRGVQAAFAVSPVATVAAALVNGSNVVGWTNLTGLAESSHRIGTAALTFELMPKRPGGMRIALSGMEGSLLPANSFNQGAATDAEESRGFGVEVAVSDATERIRLTGGLSRSRFLNPADPLLFGDTTVVAVQPTTRTARFGELGLELLRGLRLTPTVSASLGVTARHERVDPLYRSVGAWVQPDQENNALELTGGFGALALQAGLARSRDNLGRVASILTAQTRARSLSAALPVAALVGAPRATWFLPAITWRWQATEQAGEGLPADGGFSESHIPDQENRNQSAGLAWGAAAWTLNYRWNQSFQDNRQAGREQADFRSIVHAVSLGVNPGPSVTATADLSAETQKSFETSSTQRLERIGAGLQWRATRTTALVGSVSQSWGADELAEERSRNTEYQLELSQGFTLYGRSDRGTQGRFFVRYARARAARYPFQVPSLVDPVITWTLNAGGSFRLY